MQKEEIRVLREKFKLTQTELAYRIGVNQVTVSRWESGRSKPSSMARKLLRMLQIQVKKTSEK